MAADPRITRLLSGSPVFVWWHRLPWQVRIGAIAAIIIIFFGACALIRSIDPDQDADGYIRSQVPHSIKAASLCSDLGCEDAILVQGTLLKTFAQDLAAAVDAAKGRRLWLCLHSPGGYAEAALLPPLPDNVSTCVAPVRDASGVVHTALCMSSCAWVWMAGRNREVSARAHLGVHDSSVSPSCLCWFTNWLAADSLRNRLSRLDQAYADAWGMDEPGLRERVRQEMQAIGSYDMRLLSAENLTAAGLQRKPARNLLVVLKGT